MDSLPMVSYGEIHYIAGKNIKKQAINGGLKEFVIVQKSMMLLGLIISEALMNITPYLMEIKMQDEGDGKKALIYFV